METTTKSARIFTERNLTVTFITALVSVPTTLLIIGLSRELISVYSIYTGMFPTLVITPLETATVAIFGITAALVPFKLFRHIGEWLDDYAARNCPNHEGA